MQKKIKLTFAIPKRMQKEMREKITADGYSMRGKSDWVAEAINSLLKSPNMHEFVNINDDLTGLDKMETILVSTELKDKLSQAVLDIRRENLALEGIQSRIIRASILQRLLRN